MRHFGVVEDDAILKFAGIAEHDAVTDDHVFADVTAAAYFAVASDPGRAFDGCSVLDHCSAADIDILTYEGSAHDPPINGRFQTELEIAADLLQDIPDLRTVIENSPVLCLIEIEKI